MVFECFELRWVIFARKRLWKTSKGTGNIVQTPADYYFIGLSPAIVQVIKSTRLLPLVLAKLLPCVLGKLLPPVLKRLLPHVLAKLLPCVLAKLLPPVLTRLLPHVLAKLLPLVLAKLLPLVLGNWFKILKFVENFQFVQNYRLFAYHGPQSKTNRWLPIESLAAFSNKRWNLKHCSNFRYEIHFVWWVSNPIIEFY